jgi:hypothetical protein
MLLSYKSLQDLYILLTPSLGAQDPSGAKNNLKHRKPFSSIFFAGSNISLRQYKTTGPGNPPQDLSSGATKFIRVLAGDKK